MAKQLNFWMWRGEDITLDITLDGEGSIAGQAFEFGLRSAVDEADTVPVLVTKTTGSGITILDPDARTLRVGLASEDTAPLGQDATETPYWYEVAQTGAGNNAALSVGYLYIRNRAVRP